MSVDPRAAADAVAVKTTVALRDLGDGPGLGLPDSGDEQLDPDCDLARFLRGEVDREDIEVEITIMRDGEILGRPREQPNGSNGH